MKLTYDPRYNIASLRLQEKTTQVETIRVSDELLVDIAPDGTASSDRAEHLRRAGDGQRWVPYPNANPSYPFAATSSHRLR